MRFLGYSWPFLLALLPYYTQINPTVVGTLSLLELIWIMVNGPGALFSLFNFLDARTDYALACAQPTLTEAASHQRKDDIRSAGYARRNERTILLKQLINLFVGALAALTPPPVNVQNATVGSITITLVFIGGTVLLTYTSFRNRQDRKEAQGRIRAAHQVAEVEAEARDEVRDRERDIERDAERDVGRDISRDVDRDVDRDRTRDIGRDLDRDAAQGKVVSE